MSKSKKKAQSDHGLAARTKLLEELRTLSEEHSQHQKSCNSVALKLGKCLTDLKPLIPHGQWETAIKDCFPVGERQAQRFMQLYARKEELDLLQEDWTEKLTLTQALGLLKGPKKAQGSVEVESAQEVEAETEEAETEEAETETKTDCQQAFRVIKQLQMEAKKAPDLTALRAVERSSESIQENLKTLAKACVQRRHQLDSRSSTQKTRSGAA